MDLLKQGCAKFGWDLSSLKFQDKNRLWNFDDTIAIRSRLGNSYRDTDSIRNRQSLSKIIAANSRENCQNPTFQVSWEILPSPGTERRDGVKAKPPRFRLLAANGRPKHISPHPCYQKRCFSETKPHSRSCPQRPPTMRQ